MFCWANNTTYWSFHQKLFVLILLEAFKNFLKSVNKKINLINYLNILSKFFWVDINNKFKYIKEGFISQTAKNYYSFIKIEKRKLLLTENTTSILI